MTDPRHILNIVFGFVILVAVLKLGNLAAHWIPLPGSLIGMVLLAFLLGVHDGPAARAVIACGTLLLRYFAFFFIPAGVGVMVYLHQLRADWFAIAASLILSSLVSLVATALTMHFLVKRNRAAPLEQNAVPE